MKPAATIPTLFPIAEFGGSRLWQESDPLPLAGNINDETAICPHCKGSVVQTEHRAQLVLVCSRCWFTWPVRFNMQGKGTIYVGKVKAIAHITMYQTKIYSSGISH